MTGTRPPEHGARPASSESAPATTDTAVRRVGRELLVALHAALKSLELYPVENEQVQRTFDDVEAAAQRLLGTDDELEIRLAGNLVFVNGTRLRLELDHVASAGRVLEILRRAGVGVLRVGPGVARREWQVLLSLLLRAGRGETDVAGAAALQQRLAQAAITRVVVEAPVGGEARLRDEQHARETAKRTYERSVTVMKGVVTSLRMGRRPNVKQVKRAVQGIVDQVLQNEVSLIGLTTIRDYDEYTFTHSVNVCILAVAMGRMLGLSQLELYELGFAALFHDVGKSRVPVEVLNKEGALTDAEWRVLQAHPWLGVLTLFGLRSYGEIPYRAIVAAYEHHMKTDLTGYPKPIRPRRPSLFSKIVAVADGFDAGTSRRVYQTVPMQPDEVLREMLENPRRGHDRALVQVLINLLGIYPVGTCVVLDTGEVAVVHAPNPHTGQRDRPLVRVVVTPGGAPLRPGQLTDLAETNPDGSFRRSIRRVTDPARYGIEPGDSFV